MAYDESKFQLTWIHKAESISQPESPLHNQNQNNIYQTDLLSEFKLFS